MNFMRNTNFWRYLVKTVVLYPIFGKTAKFAAQRISPAADDDADHHADDHDRYDDGHGRDDGDLDRDDNDIVTTIIDGC